jgi:hypothetical protein
MRGPEARWRRGVRIRAAHPCGDASAPVDVVSVENEELLRRRPARELKHAKHVMKLPMRVAHHDDARAMRRLQRHQRLVDAQRLDRGG